MEAAQPAAGASVAFPEPEDKDFDDDIGEEERKHYIATYKDLNAVKNVRLHCTACDRHLGCAAKSDSRMRTHPMLRTLVCRECHTFYNSGEFERGDDGSELYCRWCGQGGQVYCCSACPHVFCAKCIKRNMGVAMTREIESLDDWKCFKCMPQGLWTLRATCWALLRYCDLKNKLAYMTEDPELKEKYQKECAVDDSECCKHKKRNSSTGRKKKEKDKEEEDKKNAIIAKIPSGIQVKKFATVSVDSILKAGDKKGIKRPASPLRQKNMPIRAPIPIAPYPRPIAPMPIQSQHTSPRMPPNKKFKMQHAPIIMNHLLDNRKYGPRPIRPRIPAIQYPPIHLGQMNNVPFGATPFNGFNTFSADNINLSLDSLTQGLDMASVAALASRPSDVNENDVVCTPDFPMEPLCEVTEDPPDDDVECITPGPVVQPKPPLLPQRSLRSLPDLSPDNIIQMTDNDVTVNALTGGLKFRVDPQTLSSNKMYRLPDGRIFAINSNPNMPGGYSATIVAVSDAGPSGTPTAAPLRGTTYAANLSTVVTPANPPPLSKIQRKNRDSNATSTPQSLHDTSKRRSADMSTPVEWYRYNLVDAVDALEYSLSRLHRLKKEADTRHLRTRTVVEMRSLHLQLERHLHTSSSRFQEIRENLNRGFKSYLRRKGKPQSDDDDDVEILTDEPPATHTGDDPIFIDENSMESRDGSEHELTTLSSEHNDSTERNPGKDKSDPFTDINKESFPKIKSVQSLSEESSNLKDYPPSALKQIELIDNAESEEIPPVNLKNANESEAKDADFKDITETEAKDSDVKDDTETEAKDADFGDVTETEAKDVDSINKSEGKDTEAKDGTVVETIKNESVQDTSESETIEDANSKSGETDKGKLVEKPRPHVEEENIESVTLEKGSSGVEALANSLSDDEENCKGLNENKVYQSEEAPKKNTDIKDNSEKDEDISDLAIPEIVDKLFESAAEVEEKSKLNGSGATETSDADIANGEAEAFGQSNDNELQMSDEMIDDLLADDSTPDTLAAHMHMVTEPSLDSLASNSEFN